MPVENSRLGGFYKLSVSERRELLQELAELSDEQVDAWAQTGELSESAADRIIENVVGTLNRQVSFPNSMKRENAPSTKVVCSFNQTDEITR